MIYIEGERFELVHHRVLCLGFVGHGNGAASNAVSIRPGRDAVGSGAIFDCLAGL